MSHLPCMQFRANFWRPTICAYCYRPKSQHSKKLTNETEAGRRSSSFGSAAQMRVRVNHYDKVSDEIPISARSATIGCSSPSMRERKQFSEPPFSPGYDRVDVEPTVTEQRRVGIVKPYAVVELNEQWVQRNMGRLASKGLLQRAREQSNTASVAVKPAPTRRRLGSCNYVENATTRRRIIPKRKAPPPPNRPLSQMTRACSVPSVSTLCVEQDNQLTGAAKSTAKEYELFDAVHLRKSPPRKPPRTESTFIDDINDMLINTALAVKANREGSCSGSTPSPLPSQASEYEPLRRPLAYNADPKSITVTTIPHQVLELFDTTLTGVASNCLKQLHSRNIPWELDWANLTMCTDELGQQHLFYHKDQAIIVEPSQSFHSTELIIAKSIDKHLNISLATGTLPSAPADLVDIFPLADQYIVYDSSSLLTPLREHLPLWRRRLSEEEYIHQVLMILVQVLRGLSYLYSNGVVHRDIGLDSVLVEPLANEYIFKIGGFQYALQHSGPLSVTSFIYAFHELKWLGGTDACLPPEIMDTADYAQTLNYSHTDSFAIGCLIYELMTGENPFGQDSKLIFTQYRDQDLPPFPQTSPMAYHLRHLACLLLRREPTRRLSVTDAFLVSQEMLWFPEQCLTQPVTNTGVLSELLISKATLLAKLAKREESEPVGLEDMLKAEFLTTVNSADCVRTIAVFTT